MVVTNPFAMKDNQGKNDVSLNRDLRPSFVVRIKGSAQMTLMWSDVLVQLDTSV